MAQVLNPFGCSLNRNHRTSYYRETQELAGKPVYRNGDITIWREQKKCYDTCWKNIIVTQTVGAPRELADALAAGIAPEQNTSSYHHYQRMLQAIEDGKRYARELNFTITTI